MGKKIAIYILGVFIAMVSINKPAYARATEDFYKCTGKISGEWAFGRAPNGCNAKEFGDDQVVLKNFGIVIFDDKASRTSERQRYMEELHAVIRDAAEYYLKKRKPNVDPTELQWWTLAIISTASHESYASQYRKHTDGTIKMMRGDVGHGHGMMQIDDRSHFPAITQGIAWNIITNLTYAMDIYYAGWQRAPTQSCVNGETKYELRARAAWSAYNGGPSQICRFANPNSSWAQNDKNFYNMLKNKTWQAWVQTPKPVASINVACLIENRENCLPPTTPPTGPVQEGVLYKIPAGSHCVLKGKSLACVKDMRDAICLRAVSNYASTTAQSITAAQMTGLTVDNRDRHALCETFDSTLFKVGDFLDVKKAIYVRNTPGGGKVGIVLAGDVVEVLDFEVREFPDNDRYYKIHMGKLEGYLYAGTEKDFASWATLSTQKASHPATLANVGESIEIVNPAGVNMRATANGTLMLTIPAKAVVQVLDRTISTGENHVYYKVKYNNRTGYIYSGRLLPTDTTASWTTRIRTF